MESAFSENRKEVTTADLVQAIDETNSLMGTMGDSLKTLMDEYKKRKYKNAAR